MKDGWNGFNVLHAVASRVAALDLGIVSLPIAKPTSPKFVYLLGSDDYNPSDVPSDAFVVYQGHHGDVGASRADVILPGKLICLLRTNADHVPNTTMLD